MHTDSFASTPIHTGRHGAAWSSMSTLPWYLGGEAEGRDVVSPGLRALSLYTDYSSRCPRRCILASGNETWDLGWHVIACMHTRV